MVAGPRSRRYRASMPAVRPRRDRASAALAVVLLFWSSCTSPPRTGDALPPEFAAVLRAYEAAWQAHDAEALTALFTEDGWVLSNQREPVHGHTAIAERYAKSGGPLSLRSLHWERQGDLAIILGAYAHEPGAPDSGKFTLTLRRGEHGGWRILSDMDNVNTRR